MLYCWKKIFLIKKKILKNFLTDYNLAICHDAAGFLNLQTRYIL